MLHLTSGDGRVSWCIRLNKKKIKNPFECDSNQCNDLHIDCVNSENDKMKRKKKTLNDNPIEYARQIPSIQADYFHLFTQ